jgi:transcriptional regulator with XRE-family HTH domain
VGETQQEFAHRLGTAVRTIARWEKVRAPSGASLARLEGLASANGHLDLASLFGDALAAELGRSEFIVTPWVFELYTEAEHLWVATLLSVLRSPRYERRRARLLLILQEPARATIQLIEEGSIGHRVRAECCRLLALGLDPADIAKALDVPSNEIRQVAMVETMQRVMQEGI